ncbi:hypothetical protein [Klebsiella sp. BIGb0407]|uniref:hypothetical protein n=1 Tax=Klebsiella sp. BIGb0407 TaxID=2940603 RepID=UPI0021671E16|nr:hypothetical protein [Klebsiella sp. BIGb0407]MCS3430262.1 hypothetical protein [Klebsiella sp. BIGb0407]
MPIKSPLNCSNLAISLASGGSIRVLEDKGAIYGLMYSSTGFETGNKLLILPNSIYDYVASLPAEADKHKLT